MSITRCLSASLAAFVVSLTVGAGLVVAQSTHVLVPADKVQWAKAPPMLPAGAQIEKGPVTLRLRLPANYSIPAHWHSMAERVTVLSGALHVGMGDKLDRMASQALKPGGFVSLPANMHHFAWTAAPTVIQISLEGPFDIFYVNPADNPQKTQTQ
jgi:hypothetical protein